MVNMRGVFSPGTGRRREERPGIRFVGLDKALSLIGGLSALTGAFLGGSSLLEIEEKRTLLVGVLFRALLNGSFGRSWLT